MSAPPVAPAWRCASNRSGLESNQLVLQEGLEVLGAAGMADVLLDLGGCSGGPWVRSASPTTEAHGRTKMTWSTHILSIEDDDRIRQPTGPLLEEEGDEVDGVGSADAALDLFSPGVYRAALLDVMLPGHGRLVTRSEPGREPNAVWLADPGGMFSVTIETVDGVAICRIHGETDSASAAALREAMGGLAAYRKVVLDFSGVPFIDSAGLGTVIGGTRRIRDLGGDLVLCSARRSIHRLLHTVGMDRILPIVDTLSEALAILAEHQSAAKAMA